MADSIEDLKREMEEFERGESSESGSADPVEPQLDSLPAGRTIPSWIYWVILGDFLIIGVILYLFVF